MRLLVVNVNTSEAMTETIAASARRHAAAGTEIVPLTPRFGSQAVDSAFESYLAAVAVMDRVVTYRGPFDAVVLAGFGEHGRDGLQELIPQPVIEICEASALIALLLGRTYSVVTTLDKSVPMIEDRLRLAGLDSRCASVRSAGVGTGEVDSDPARIATLVAAEAKTAVEEDRAEVICLGCAGMAGMEATVGAAIAVPVVDGIGAAVRVAEATVGMGLATSKRLTYSPPPPNPLTAWPLSTALRMEEQ